MAPFANLKPIEPRYIVASMHLFGGVHRTSRPFKTARAANRECRAQVERMGRAYYASLIQLGVLQVTWDTEFDCALRGEYR